MAQSFQPYAGQAYYGAQQATPASAPSPAPQSFSPPLAYPANQVSGTSPMGVPQPMPSSTFVGSPSFASPFQFSSAMPAPSCHPSNANVQVNTLKGHPSPVVGTVAVASQQPQMAGMPGTMPAPNAVPVVAAGHVFAISLYDDRVRVCRAPVPNVVDLLRRVITAVWERGIQQEYPSDTNTNDITFKLKGRPWKDVSATESNRLLLEMVRALYLAGWRMVQPCQDPTSTVALDMLMFVPLQGVPYPYVSFTVMQTVRYDTLRVIDAPFDPRQLIGESVSRTWSQGLAGTTVDGNLQQDRKARFDVKLKGNPFGYGSDEAVFLLCDLLQHFEMHGWHVYGSLRGNASRWILYKQQA